MLVAIHQPQFMPWLGYFEKMDRADHFVLLDTVQFKKNEWQNRNRIKAVTGAQWLTVPVRFRFPARIDEVLVNDDANWRHKHLQSLRTNYAKAPYWQALTPALESFYESQYDGLRAANVGSIECLRAVLGIDTPLHVASEMAIDEEQPTQRLVELCRLLGATAYLSGPDGANYLELERFSAAGIEVIFQRFEHPDYPQLFGAFEAHLSTLDLVLNCGPASGDIVRSGRRDDDQEPS